MKRVLFGIPLVLLASSAALAAENIPPYTPDIGPRQGSWEATLGGTGASQDEFDRNTFAITGSVAYYALEWLPIGFRQSYISNFGDNVLDQHAGNSRVFVEFQLPIGPFQPFLGVVGGFQYGDDEIDEDYVYGPEAGIKFWVSEDTFLFAQLEYQIEGDDDFDEGNGLYSFGFGLTF